MDQSLIDFVVQKAPPSILYIPNFITQKEEERIIEKVYNAPKPKWTQLMNRRLQNWGGIPGTHGMILESLPDWLSVYVEKVNQLKVYDKGNLKANHVLVNEYQPGQGIMPHVDGPLFYPTIATINCGSHTVLEFRRNFGYDVKDGHEEYSLLLEPRSLIVIQDDMYTEYLHGIKEIQEDVIDDKIVNIDKTLLKIGDVKKRSTRISLTIRHVPKSCKLKLKLCR